MANELKKRGMTISPAGVRCVWLRHDLENIKKGLKTLAAKSLHESLILTERANGNLGESQRDQSMGEFQSECPGYCGAQDTFYVGTLKGVGRIYQQTFIDTYRKVVLPSSMIARLRSQLRICSMIECCHSLKSMRLSLKNADRSGTQYCGSDGHEYELYLALEDIDHTPNQGQESPDQPDL